MAQHEMRSLDTDMLPAHPRQRHRVVRLAPEESFFSQGDPSDSIFYLQEGRAKVTVVSRAGKEATVTILSAGDFVGEESLAEAPGRRLSAATAITECIVLEMTREGMIAGMREDRGLRDRFLSYLIARNMRTQADLVDHLFNSSERRLARMLLLMAECGDPGEQEVLIPKISQETLAEMVGTTRSRVSFFMNRFRKLGFIEYKDQIRVRKSLLNLVLLDQYPNFKAEGAPDSVNLRKPRMTLI